MPRTSERKQIPDSLETDIKNMLELAVLEGYKGSVPWGTVKDLLREFMGFYLSHDISVYMSKAVFRMVAVVLTEDAMCPGCHVCTGGQVRLCVYCQPGCILSLTLCILSVRCYTVRQ